MNPKAFAKSGLRYLRPIALRARGYRPICNEFPHGHIIILSDGSVTTCCADALGKNVFSSAYDHSIETIWKDHLERVLDAGLLRLDLCRYCPALRFVPPDSPDFQAWRNLPNDYPDSITIEVMGACNYACCSARDVHRHRPVKPDLDRIFVSLRPYLPHLRRLRLFNYGEPLLHDGFLEFVRKCRDESNQLKMLVSTNGILLDRFADGLIESRLDYLLVSVHGGPGTDKMLRYARQGADYERVKRNLANFLEKRASKGAEYPKLSLRVILFHWNDSNRDMDEIRALAKTLGLQATAGDSETDNYHWILNADPTGNISSKRFTRGSADLRKLIESREFFAG